MLHPNAALGAMDAAGSVVQHHRNVPQRHEIPGLPLQVIIPRSRTQALATAGLASRVGLHKHGDMPVLAGAFLPNLTDDKSSKFLHGAQERFNSQLHGWRVEVVVWLRIPGN